MKMLPIRTYKTVLIVGAFLIAMSFLASMHLTMAQDRDVIVVTDIVSWEHPVKKVFAKYSVVLKKVELLRNKKYPVFYVDFPWDPQTSPNASRLNRLATELLLANGKNDYAIQSERDGIRIEYKYDKPKKTLHEDIVSLADNPVPK